MKSSSALLKKILFLVGMIPAVLSVSLGAHRSLHSSDIVEFSKNVACRRPITCQHGTRTGNSCGKLNSQKRYRCKFKNCRRKGILVRSSCNQLHKASECPEDCPQKIILYQNI
ncbi:hypothetical protein PPACK8108_LOCUS2974, partial [Phakopsora pachyrhizi]